MLCFITFALLCIPTHSAQGFQFSTFLPTIGILGVLFGSVVVVLDPAFSTENDLEYFFMSVDSFLNIISMAILLNRFHNVVFCFQ